MGGGEARAIFKEKHEGLLELSTTVFVTEDRYRSNNRYNNNKYVVVDMHKESKR